MFVSDTSWQVVCGLQMYMFAINKMWMPRNASFTRMFALAYVTTTVKVLLGYKLTWPSAKKSCLHLKIQMQSLLKEYETFGVLFHSYVCGNLSWRLRGSIKANISSANKLLTTLLLPATLLFCRLLFSAGTIQQLSTNLTCLAPITVKKSSVSCVVSFEGNRISLFLTCRIMLAGKSFFDLIPLYWKLLE